MSRRNLKDATLIKSVALPAAGATANSVAVDLGAAAPGLSVGALEVQVEVPATPNLADTKNIVVNLQDSDDGVTFAALGLTFTIGPAAGGTGGAATLKRFRLPSTVRRYVRASAAVDASGGSNVAVSMTMSLCF